MKMNTKYKVSEIYSFNLEVWVESDLHSNA